MKNLFNGKILKTIGSASLSVGAVSFLSGISLVGCSADKKEQPNVIIVFTDDQGYGDLSCHGNPYVQTPVLDNLYQESIRFTNFHVDPCCAPSRAALLTGQYSSRSGVWHTIGGRSLLQKDKVTMADIFQQSGFSTGIFGKWHLGENYPFRPNDRGFDESIIHRGGGVGANPDYQGNDYYDDTYVHNGEYEKYNGYCNTVWFNEATKFIKNNQDNPFFCFISTNVPHAPLLVDSAYSAPYKSMVSERLANYYGMISKIDEDIGILLEELEDLKLAENTIFIFMTDNGPCPWFGGIIIDDEGFVKEGYSAGMRGGKIWGYENAHRVPFFLRWPAAGINKGRDINNLTAHFDLLPTLIDMCRLTKPEKLNFDGVSLKPLIMDEDVQWPERTLFVHNQRVEFPVKYKDYQVLTERWRLIKHGQNLELYDIMSDPGQEINIIKQHPEVKTSLFAQYENWWEDISVDFDKYNEIIIGSEKENPGILHSHDSHRNTDGKIWMINVEKEGQYEFKVSRFPFETKRNIFPGKDVDKGIITHKANLNIGSINTTVDVSPNMKYASFIVHLEAGSTSIQAWFTENTSGRKTGISCIGFEYIGIAEPKLVNISKK